MLTSQVEPFFFSCNLGFHYQKKKPGLPLSGGPGNQKKSGNLDSRQKVFWKWQTGWNFIKRTYFSLYLYRIRVNWFQKAVERCLTVVANPIFMCGPKDLQIRWGIVEALHAMLRVKHIERKMYMRHLVRAQRTLKYSKLKSSKNFLS